MKEYIGTDYDRIDAIGRARALCGTFEIERERFCTMTLWKVYKVSAEPSNDCIIRVVG